MFSGMDLLKFGKEFECKGEDEVNVKEYICEKREVRKYK